MKQLSGLDAAFLTLETHNSTRHVGGSRELAAVELDIALPAGFLQGASSEFNAAIQAIKTYASEKGVSTKVFELTEHEMTVIQAPTK
jgi:hypothetical protein